MTYADFKKRRGELHVAYHEAKRLGDAAAVRNIDSAIGDLERSVEREYQISGRMLILVRVKPHAIGIGAKRTDRGVFLVQLPHHELEMFDSGELLTLAGLRTLIQGYEDGIHDWLPPSGVWP